MTGLWVNHQKCVDVVNATEWEAMSQKDLRVRRTHQSLRQAFMDLLNENGFKAMTVQEVTERAMVNRSTFYRHYQDKYDLAISIVDDIVERLIKELDPPPAGPEQISFEEPIRAWIKLLAVIRHNAVLFRLLLDHGGIVEFRNHLQTLADELVRQRLGELWRASNQPRMPLDVIVGYCKSAFLGMLVWWLDQGAEYTPEQMAGWLQELLVLGPFHAVGLNLPHTPD